jgi:hypothetical protein
VAQRAAVGGQTAPPKLKDTRITMVPATIPVLCRRRMLVGVLECQDTSGSQFALFLFHLRAGGKGTNEYA